MKARIVSKPDDDTLVFMARPADAVGPSTGSINRFTGMASINVMTLVDGLLKFKRPVPDGSAAF
jgi:hypothetical protein